MRENQIHLLRAEELITQWSFLKLLIMSLFSSTPKLTGLAKLFLTQETGKNFMSKPTTTCDQDYRGPN